MKIKCVFDGYIGNRLKYIEVDFDDFDCDTVEEFKEIIEEIV